MVNVHCLLRTNARDFMSSAENEDGDWACTSCSWDPVDVRSRTCLMKSDGCLDRVVPLTMRLEA
jgi:hypothetical protein